MVRVTFSLDDATVAQIRLTAARLRKAQSHVVRDAVASKKDTMEIVVDLRRALGVDR